MITWYMSNAKSSVRAMKSGLFKRVSYKSSKGNKNASSDMPLSSLLNCREGHSASIMLSILSSDYTQETCKNTKKNHKLFFFFLSFFFQTNVKQGVIKLYVLVYFSPDESMCWAVGHVALYKAINTSQLQTMQKGVVTVLTDS